VAAADVPITLFCAAVPTSRLIEICAPIGGYG
jgi:hypothetical protein